MVRARRNGMTEESRVTAAKAAEDAAAKQAAEDAAPRKAVEDAAAQKAAEDAAAQKAAEDAAAGKAPEDAAAKKAPEDAAAKKAAEDAAAKKAAEDAAAKEAAEDAAAKEAAEDAGFHFARRVLVYLLVTLAVAAVCAVVFMHILPEDAAATALGAAGQRMDPACASQFGLALLTTRELFALRMVVAAFGTAVILVGALVALVGVQARFKLGISGGGQQGPKGDLSTSSPGLVLVTLGAGLVLAAVLNNHHMKFEPPVQCFGAAVRAPATPASSAAQGGTNPALDWSFLDRIDTSGTERDGGVGDAQ